MRRKVLRFPQADLLANSSNLVRNRVWNCSSHSETGIYRQDHQQEQDRLPFHEDLYLFKRAAKDTASAGILASTTRWAALVHGLDHQATQFKPAPALAQAPSQRRVVPQDHHSRPLKRYLQAKAGSHLTHLVKRPSLIEVHQSPRSEYRVATEGRNRRR